jgi:hypothetical protein
MNQKDRGEIIDSITHTRYARLTPVHTPNVAKSSARIHR